MSLVFGQSDICLDVAYLFLFRAEGNKQRKQVVLEIWGRGQEPAREMKFAST